MKKIEGVMVATATEVTLVDWAHSLLPSEPRPSLGEAASMALEEFARQKRELRREFAAAARRVEAKLRA